jgi:hypothetical protein
MPNSTPPILGKPYVSDPQTPLSPLEQIQRVLDLLKTDEDADSSILYSPTFIQAFAALKTPEEIQKMTAATVNAIKRDGMDLREFKKLIETQKKMTTTLGERRNHPVPTAIVAVGDLWPTVPAEDHDIRLPEGVSDPSVRTVSAGSRQLGQRVTQGRTNWG